MLAANRFKVQLILIVPLMMKVADSSCNFLLHTFLCAHAGIHTIQGVRVEAIPDCQVLITPILDIDMIFNIDGHDYEPDNEG